MNTALVRIAQQTNYVSIIFWSVGFFLSLFFPLFLLAWFAAFLCACKNTNKLEALTNHRIKHFFGCFEVMHCFWFNISFLRFLRLSLFFSLPLSFSVYLSLSLFLSLPLSLSPFSLSPVFLSLSFSLSPLAVFLSPSVSHSLTPPLSLLYISLPRFCLSRIEQFSCLKVNPFFIFLVNSS